MTVWMPPEWVGGSGSPVSPPVPPDEPPVPVARAAEPEPEPPARGERQPYSWFSPPHAREAAEVPTGSVFSGTVSATAARRVPADSPAGSEGRPAAHGDAGSEGLSRDGQGVAEPAGSAPPLPRRVPQVPPPPFGVAVSPGGESLFQPPKRRAQVERLRDGDAAEPPGGEIPRRPAAGGLIAGWNRPAPEEPPAGGPGSAGPDPAVVGDTAEPGAGPVGRPPAPAVHPASSPAPAGPGSATRRAAELWSRRAAGPATAGRAGPGVDGPASAGPGRAEPGGGPPSAAGLGGRPGAAYLSGRSPITDRPDRPPAEAGRSGVDPWERPARQARPDDWDRIAGTTAGDRPAAGGWETVLPPVGGARRGHDGAEDRAAGVDEATTFISQWGPPPLAVPRPTDDRRPGPPAAPSRAGAGRSADNPTDRPIPRAAASWSPPAPEAGPPPPAPIRPASGPGPTVADEPTEVMGPLDVGAWSLQGPDRTAARARTRQRQPDPEERVAEHQGDRGPAGAGAAGGGHGPPAGNGRGGNGPGRNGPGRNGPGRNGRGRDGRGPTGRGASERDRDRPRIRDGIRTVVRGAGQTLLTVGVIVLLFAAYEVWFTDLVNHRTQKHLTTALQKRWYAGDDPTVGVTPTRPGQKVRSIPLGDAFALIYIPEFGTDYVFSVVEGTGMNELDRGPGHYVDTALPGQVGNVAIAGHRVGKGAPFLNLDRIKAGSAIVIRTRSYWYTYRVLGDQATGDAQAVSAIGIPGREIVDPSDVAVVAPVPDKPAATPTRRLLTLTTCHPKFTARQRLVIHAQLEGAPFPVGKGTPPSMTSS